MWFISPLPSLVAEFSMYRTASWLVWIRRILSLFNEDWISKPDDGWSFYTSCTAAARFDRTKSDRIETIEILTKGSCYILNVAMIKERRVFMFVGGQSERSVIFSWVVVVLATRRAGGWLAGDVSAENGTQNCSSLKINTISRPGKLLSQKIVLRIE